MQPPAPTLIDPHEERDACGVGFVVRASGAPSPEIVAKGLAVLASFAHRGAAGDDGASGDGAGMLLQIPDRFLRGAFGESGRRLPPAGGYAVGMAFLPARPAELQAASGLIEAAAAEAGLDWLGWREVPVRAEILGPAARATMPAIRQWAVGRGGLTDAEFARQVYVARRRLERRAARQLAPDSGFHVASFSRRTLVYKGMLMGAQLGAFFPDLAHPDTASALAVVHQRYSTNTAPSWKLAQPFRVLAHNGEINTLRGNLNQMAARERQLASPRFGEALKDLVPVIEPGGSDSACLDNAAEFLEAAGRELPHALMMLMPQAWGPNYPLGPDVRGFFEYHAGLMEPWDGPAAVAFSDGEQVGALVDRNGLRPVRYTLTDDGLLVLASEAGGLETDPARVAEKGSLRPGQMILADTRIGRVLRDADIKATYAREKPYRRWVRENKIVLHGFLADVRPVAPDPASLRSQQRLFGYTREEVQAVLAPMAASGHEPVGSMGYDAPLAALSDQPHLLYDYFKQLFAQVTNPPIDPIREESVMSLMTFMGNPPNILEDGPRQARLIKLRHPILSNEDLACLRTLNLEDFCVAALPLGFPARDGPAGLKAALTALCRRAAAAVTDRRLLLVLSDRRLPDGAAPIPALLAVSVVNRCLVRLGARTASSLIVETGEARNVHHLALLLGYGATAVNPSLAFETIADLAERGRLEPGISLTQALDNYIRALCRGLLKIMSKMGIATLRSYRSAQVFEAVGLQEAFVEACFHGTASRIGGIGLADVAAESLARYGRAQGAGRDAETLLDDGSRYRFRVRGERHLWSPESIHALQTAVRRDDPAAYARYAESIHRPSARPATVRALLRFKPGIRSVAVDAVEPAPAILKRLAVSAMSFGALSREAHETLAVAMNRIGGMSNSGEGGEDPARYSALPNGDSRCSTVKQVASGRFGVTADYLTHARELQIKMAQGAKPGEGGQLPGHKVTAEIARVRHATSGVTLISPPPHHDIYSIEDLKQLIDDLRQVNPAAVISVKLASVLGVGTIASGVVKAGADKILISGFDGGTGAAPLSSIQYAGIPWELGLAETQQALVRNGLRDRVTIQVDGQLKTGRDVVVAALLGAEEFGFATAALVACGCVLMRQCHRNFCPAGIATQDPALRKHFAGRPEHVVRLFAFLAEEVRRHLAQIGCRSLDEAVGRADLLEMDPGRATGKAAGVDLSRLLAGSGRRPGAARRRVRPARGPDHALDDRLWALAREALERGEKAVMNLPIHTADRSVGAFLSGAVVRQCGGAGLPDDTIIGRFTGSAGQSFGAFAARGVTLILKGEANDYVGKGLSGARLILKPFPGAAYDPSSAVIAGNVLLYGATSGEAFIQGRVGERFAVRNSGAVAVVEGVGDHGCEYMTGGRVVILGETGVNFAAGMSGGLAYVYDEARGFDGRCNLDMVDLEPVSDPEDREELQALIRRHAVLTGSRKAASILDRWGRSVSLFVKVFPMDYRRALGRMRRDDAAVEREEALHG